MKDITNVVVAIGTDFVTIRKNRRHKPIVAKILGTDQDSDGDVRKIWLDRLVHGVDEYWTGQWQADGAISTVLTFDP